ncbi:MAG: hypothetical protein K5695_02165 [Oscillospiraceae bacterium]|nr:hypothetical protein [Oscillospiraceae bacterium]
MADKEKAYTLKTVQAELAKLEKAKEKKRSRMQELTAELKAINAQIRELRAISDRLYQESIQAQITAVWFGKKKLTKEEIERMLEISVGLPKKIDILDDKKQGELSITPPADTSDS